MKKLTAILLVFCMALTACALAACSATPDDPSNPNNPNNPQNPGAQSGSLYEIVTSAMANVKAAESYDANILVDLTTDLMGQVSKDGSNLTAKATALGSDSPVIGVSGTVTYSGYDTQTNYYLEGEWMYFLMYEAGYKQLATREEFAQQAADPTTLFVVLPESVFANATGTADNAVISVDEETFEALYRDVIVPVVDDVVGEDLSQVTTKDAKILVSVQNGQIRSFGISFTCEIVAGNDKVEYKYTQTVTFNSLNQAVTVTPPEGYAQFPELDWG